MTGRKRIYTDFSEVDSSNIIEVLNKSLYKHKENAAEIAFLLEYEKGVQPIDKRIKEIRPEINIKVKKNMAARITDAKLSYKYCYPVTYVQKSQSDFGDKNADKDDKKINFLNEVMDEEGKAYKDQELARYIEICGVGYRIVRPKRNVYGKSVVDIKNLNPLRTFVVYSNDIFSRKVLSCTYAEKENGDTVCGCYTDKEYFEIRNWVDTNGVKKSEIINTYKNIPRINPIIEYTRDPDRMGCFEKVISLIDALNIVTSDRVNDLVQHVQSLLWMHNAELTEEQKEDTSNGMWLFTKSIGNGYEPRIQFLNNEINESGIQELADDLKNEILEIANVPDRKDLGGGSTGSAMSMTNGWKSLELETCMHEPIRRNSEREMLELVIGIMNESSEVKAGLKNIDICDVDIKFPRNKTYDIATKVNSMSTMINSGIHPLHAIETAELFTDPQTVYNDSKEILMEKRSNTSAGMYTNGKIDTNGNGVPDKFPGKESTDYTYPKVKVVQGEKKKMQDMSDQPQKKPESN